MSNTNIQGYPEGFELLSQAISRLSKGILESVTDLVQTIRVSDEIIAGKMTGNIQILMDCSDEEAREFGMKFLMRPENDFRLELLLGRTPMGWNKGVLNQALYDFALFMTKWQPVHSVLFCPMLNPRETYTVKDLKESYYTQEGWVLNIRGLFNDGDDFLKGLNLFPMERENPEIEE